MNFNIHSVDVTVIEQVVLLLLSLLLENYQYTTLPFSLDWQQMQHPLVAYIQFTCSSLYHH